MRRWIGLLVLLCLLPTAAGAVSFSIADYAMDIVVTPDGTGIFTETVTYAYNGEYNGILMTIRHAGVGFSDLDIYEGGRELKLVAALNGVPYTYTAATQGDQTDIKVYAPGSGGTRVFTIVYRMDGLARRYRDAARINQMLLRAETGYQRAVFTLTLPGSGAGQIQPFAHGALFGGEIAVRGGTLTFGPSALRDGDFVEVQVLFPEQWIADAERIDADIVQDTLAVEMRIAGEREREAARTRALALGVMASLGVYALVFLLCFFKARRRYGLMGHIPSVTDNEMLSSIPGAMAQVLRGKAVSSAGLAATLMELTERGVLAMRAEAEDTCFTLTGGTNGLLPHQRHLVKWLFEGRDVFWINSLDVGDDYQAARAFINHYGRFRALVAEDARDAGWTYQNGGARTGLSVTALALGLLIAGALAVLAQSLTLAVLAVVLSVLFCILFTRLRRLTDEGEARLGAINGFLENYADTLEKDPRAVLGRAPLLMALGYLEPMADWIDAHPDRGYDQHWDDTPVWMYAGWHHSARRMNRTVQEAYRHNASVPDPNSSDSSGSGGGSSGGSGGGSSHGAW